MIFPYLVSIWMPAAPKARDAIYISVCLGFLDPLSLEMVRCVNAGFKSPSNERGRDGTTDRDGKAKKAEYPGQI